MTKAKRHLAGFALITLIFATVCGAVSAEKTKKGAKKTDTAPSIRITVAPREGPGETSYGDIEGVVKNAPKDSKVVIFSFGDKWYVQPTTNAPFTTIGSGGKFSATIHGGYKFAALLVKPGYMPPDTTESLPVEGGNILKIAKADPRK